MTVESILLIVMVILSIITIFAITLQPSQKTGLMGDATDIEKREKRGAELFLYRSTVILIILFLGTAITYGAAISGLI